MPQLVILAAPEDGPEEVIYTERILPAHFDTETAAGHLIERIGWAMADAEKAEGKGEW